MFVRISQKMWTGGTVVRTSTAIQLNVFFNLY